MRRGLLLPIIAAAGLAVLLAGWLSLPGEAATIVGSLHDLSYSAKKHAASRYGLQYNDYGEVCVYCHPPHTTESTQTPAWNRPDTTASFKPYDSTTLEAAPGQPGPTSLMCLSCHDGTIAVDAILQAPDPTQVTTSPIHGKMAMYSSQRGDCFECHNYSCTGCHDFWVFTRSFLTTDLGNDHPVAVPYPASSRFQPRPAGGVFPNGVKLVNGQVECNTCHNPHDPGIEHFLRTSNNGSALCYTCHAK